MHICLLSWRESALMERVRKLLMLENDYWISFDHNGRFSWIKTEYTYNNYIESVLISFQEI